MLIAKGIGVQKNADGTITIKVEIIDDHAKGSTIAAYTGKDLEAIKATIEKDFKARMDADGDLVLNSAVVGVELVRV